MLECCADDYYFGVNFSLSSIHLQRDKNPFPFTLLTHVYAIELSKAHFSDIVLLQITQCTLILIVSISS